MTGCSKRVQYNDKWEATISNLVEQARVYIYPRLTIITNYCVDEFLIYAFKKYLIKNEYRIKPKFSTTENMQTNSIL